MITKLSEIMTTDVKTIDHHETVSKALSLMEQEHIKELPVLSKEKLAGMITLHSIITLPRYDNNLKVSKIMFMPPSLLQTNTIQEAIILMKESAVEGLPIVNEDKKVIGFVSDYDIISHLKDQFKGLIVSQLMREAPSSLTLTDNIGKARRLFFYEKVKSLPVVDDENKLIGVVQETDLIQFYKPIEKMGYGLTGKGDSLKILNAKIREILSPNYSFVRRNDSVVNAINLMLKEHLSSLIVVDENDEPIGYLSRFGLISHLYKSVSPRGIFLEFSGMKLDYLTNTLLTNVVEDHLIRISYLAKHIHKIRVNIKPLHEGEGARKYEMVLRVELTSGIMKRIKKVGYALRECLDEALTDMEKILLKEFKNGS